MTLPATSPEYALTAIQQVITEGLGAVRTIATGSFGNWGAYEGASPETLGRAAVVKTQIRITPGPWTQNPGNHPSHSDRTLIRIPYAIVGTWKVDDAGLFQNDEWKSKVFRDMQRDMNTIRKALTGPANLNLTVAGDVTGLCSGLLIFDGTTGATLDLANRTATATMNFHGIMLLSQ